MSRDEAENRPWEGPNLALEEKLYRVRYEVDPDHPHIKVDQKRCSSCSKRVCTFICPAGVYTESPSHPGQIQVRHENCLECGTCKVACGCEGIIWDYPNGGMGVRYRFG